MGKLLVALIIAIALVAAVIPAFAVKAAFAEKTLFQAVSDSIEEEYEAREKKPWKEITVFEDIKEDLSTLDEKAGIAKALSLRGNPREVARRRTGK